MKQFDLLAADICLYEAWRAPEIADIGGWQARAAVGGYRRLNSVWPARFSNELETNSAIAKVEEFYADCDLPPRFMVLATAQPSDLDLRLAQRGYVVDGPTFTMAAPVAGLSMPGEVALSADPTDAWRKLYFASVSPERRAELKGVFSRMPRERRFATATLNGEPVGTALGVFAAGCVAIECVYTVPAARGQGAARRMVTALISWAAEIGAGRMVLAVDEHNPVARRLYERAGFEIISRYHYRERR